MKQTIIKVVLGVIIIIIGVVFIRTLNFGDISLNTQTVEVEKIVEVNELDKRISDAINAKTIEINEAGAKAENLAEQQMIDSIELEVREAYSKELEAKELELRKKQKAY